MVPRRLVSVLVVAAVNSVSCTHTDQRHGSGDTASQPLTSSSASKSGAGAPALAHFWTAEPMAAPGADHEKIVAWEAEDFVESNFPTDNPFAPDGLEQASLLSNRRWIGAEAPGRLLHAEYDIVVERTDVYQFYARKFWRHGPFRFRFDKGPLEYCGEMPLLLDSVAIRKSVVANWVALGEVRLEQGHHRVWIETADPMSAVAFDRFMLVHGRHVPLGLGDREPENAAAAHGWARLTAAGLGVADGFRALLQLNPEHRLPERLQVDGAHLVSAATRKDVRLWGVNLEHEALSLPEAWKRGYARWLAGLGVNLVRLHGPFFLSNDIRRLDPRRLDGLNALRRALKHEGIYLALSINFPLWTRPTGDKSFPGYDGQPTFGLAYVDQELQKIQANWWDEVLNVRDLDDGTRLAEDPALAYIELVNEDSSLFWTMAPYSGISAPVTEELERKFGAFFAERYGALELGRSHWSTQRIRGDATDSGRLGILGLWDIANRRDARARDTAEFLARLMRDYYRRLLQSLRERTGYRGLTVCANWHTADTRYLDPLDSWANLACDLSDHHAYYEAPHRGPTASYQVSVGDEIDDRSALRLESVDLARPEAQEVPFVSAEWQVKGRPALLSEVGWPWPNRFRAEAAALSVAYASMWGVDGLAFFASRYPGWSPSLEKFAINDPIVMGQFPAAAFAFRHGLVAAGSPSGHRILREPDLFALMGLPPRTTRELHWLERLGLRQPGVPVLDPFASLVGPLELAFDGNHEPAAPDLVPWIDRVARVVRSNTGEVTLDYGRGIVSIRAPAVEAAAGFLGRAAKLQLGTTEIDLDVEYASFFAVALDGQPLQSSARLLLQVVTEVTNIDFVAPGQGLRRIKSLGHGPPIMKAVAGVVSLKRPDTTELTVSALDLEGNVRRRARGLLSGIPLLPDVTHYLVERSAQLPCPRTRPSTPGACGPP